MRLLMLLVSLLLCADLAFSGQVLCANQRIVFGTESITGGYIEELDAPHLAGRYTQAYLPWHVLPTGSIIVNGTVVMLEDIIRNYTWAEGMLLSQQQLVSYSLLKVEWDSVSTPAPLCGTKPHVEMATYHWSDLYFWKSFAELPIPCNLQVTQEYGLDSQSSNFWGSEPRLVRNGEVFGPSNGKVSMDSVLYLTKPQQRLIPMLVNYQSGAQYRLTAVSLRSCVEQITPLDYLLDGIRMALEQNSSLESGQGLWDEEDPASGIGWIRQPPPSQISVSTTSSLQTTLWPIHNCNYEGNNGACIMWFGYVNTGNKTLTLEPGSPENYLEPQNVNDYSLEYMPSTFEPGVHRDVFKLIWFCHGISPSEWIELRWHLAGNVVVVPRGSAKCPGGPGNKVASQRDSIRNDFLAHPSQRKLLGIVRKRDGGGGDDHTDCCDDKSGCAQNQPCSAPNQTMLCQLDDNKGNGHTICKQTDQCGSNWQQGHYAGQCRGTSPPCTAANSTLICYSGREICIDQRDLPRWQSNRDHPCGLGHCPTNTPAPPPATSSPQCSQVLPVCPPTLGAMPNCGPGQTLMCQTDPCSANQQDRCIPSSQVSYYLANGFSTGACSCTPSCPGNWTLLCDHKGPECSYHCAPTQQEAIDLLGQGDTRGVCVPVLTTVPPVTTTRPPVTTTHPPVTTTHPPATTTLPPATTTRPPETTTRPPETTTRPPETTTRPPTPAPTTTHPAATTTHPATTTPPATTTRAPTTQPPTPAPTTTRPVTTPPVTNGNCACNVSETVTIAGSMEGALHINPGDVLKAGYDFTMPGSHPAATVVVSGEVDIHIRCGDGRTFDITIPLPCASYSVAANENDWVPSGDQGSPLVYQGSVVAPDVCGNNGVCDASSGATFHGHVSSSDPRDPINFRFHYGDNVPATGTSWSGTLTCDVPQPLCSATTAPPATTTPAPTTRAPTPVPTTRAPTTTSPPTPAPTTTAPPQPPTTTAPPEHYPYVLPEVECTFNFENGTCFTVFAYTGSPGGVIPISAGVSNYFVPSPIDRGQPTVFLDGEQVGVLRLYWPCPTSRNSTTGTLSWVLNQTVTASSQASTCPCGCDGIPFSNRVNDSCGVCGGDGTRCDNLPHWCDQDNAKHIHIDFNRDAQNYPISQCQNMTDAYRLWNVTIISSEGPADPPMAFDSDNPPSGFEDFGTPNSDFGGPGQGAAGRIGRPGQNGQALGMILMSGNCHDAICTSGGGNNNTDHHESDCMHGDCIDFLFDRPVYVETIGLLNVEQDRIGSSQIGFYDSEGDVITTVITPDYLFANGFVPLVVNVAGVSQLKVCFEREGAITELDYIYPGSGKLTDGCGVCGGNGNECSLCNTTLNLDLQVEDNVTITCVGQQVFEFCYDTIISGFDIDRNVTIYAGFEPLPSCSIGRGSCDSPPITFGRNVGLTIGTGGSPHWQVTSQLLDSDGSRAVQLCANFTFRDLLMCHTLNDSQNVLSLAPSVGDDSHYKGSFYTSVFTPPVDDGDNDEDDLCIDVKRNSTNSFDIFVDGHGTATVQYFSAEVDVEAEIGGFWWLPDGNVKILVITHVRQLQGNCTTLLTDGVVLYEYLTGYPFQINNGTLCLPGSPPGLCTQSWLLTTTGGRGVDDFSGLKPLQFLIQVCGQDMITVRVNLHLRLLRFVRIEQLHSRLTATLTLYRDRGFTLPYFFLDADGDGVEDSGVHNTTGGDNSSLSIYDCEQVYGLLTLDVPPSYLDDFCVNFTRIEFCSSDRSFPPFDPWHSNSSGCNANNMLGSRVVLYDVNMHNYSNAIYNFSLLLNPPALCSGQAAFTFKNKVLPWGRKVLLQADWVATSTMPGNDTDSGSGSGNKRSLLTLWDDDDRDDHRPPQLITHGSSACSLGGECPPQTHIFYGGEGCIDRGRQDWLQWEGNWRWQDNNRDGGALFVTFLILFLLLALAILCAMWCCWDAPLFATAVTAPPPPNRQQYAIVVHQEQHQGGSGEGVSKRHRGGVIRSTEQDRGTLLL